jgi:L-threonylcarbamoyladenylate synthase
MIVAASPAGIAQAAETLRGGGLVALPSETVYGLGADAQNDAALRRIFAAKQRPVGHPLIVHLAEGAALSEWTSNPSTPLQRLAEAFWPGPLTVIVQSAPSVSRVATGGLQTVALRVPAHPVFQNVLRILGRGIAAPSANRFGAVSPTCADHVAESLGSEVDLILDGGSCPVGLESTIVDLTLPEPTLIRPGAISPDDLERVLRQPVARDATDAAAPGNLPSHYAPRARVELVMANGLRSRALELVAAGKRVAVLAGALDNLPSNVLRIDWPRDIDSAAARLYAALREADATQCDVILCVPPSATGLGIAILDRLQKAAGPRERS